MILLVHAETLMMLEKLVFGYFGFATLIGWNHILTALEGSKVLAGDAYSEWVVPTYTIAINVALFLNIFIGSKVSDSIKVYVGVILASISLALIPIFAVTLEKSLASPLCLAAAFLYGLGASGLQGTVQGLGAKVDGGAALQYLSLGYALSGLFGYPLFLAIGTDARAHVPFLLATAAGLTLAAIPVYFFVIAGRRSLSIEGSGKDVERSLSTVHSESETKQKHDNSIIEAAKDATQEGVTLLSTLKKLSLHVFSLWFACFLTFVVFPDEIKRWGSNVAITVYAYQIADFLGRLVIGYLPVPSIRFLSIASACRIVFLPLCVAARHALSHDAIRYTIIACLAVSLGLIMTWSFILAPGVLKDDREKVLGGYIMTFAMVLGIAAGSLAGKVFATATSSL